MQKIKIPVCAKCGGYVAPSTADAFKRISGRGEMYCAKCFDEVKVIAKPKFQKYTPNKLKGDAHEQQTKK